MSVHTGNIQKIPQEVLSLDKSIRFCAVVDKLGYIQSSKYRSDFQPILTEEDTQRHALLWTIRSSKRQSWEERLGQTRYIVTRYDLATRAVIPLPMDDDHIVLVSFDTDASNFDNIITERIIPLLEEYRFEITHGSTI